MHMDERIPMCIHEGWQRTLGRLASTTASHADSRSDNGEGFGTAGNLTGDQWTTAQQKALT